MHIKFMAHGTGSGAAASAYLMGDLDHKGVARAGVEVLRGDPVLFGALADSLPFQQRYTSAVISWATEEAPTEDEINACIVRQTNNKYLKCAIVTLNQFKSRFAI